MIEENNETLDVEETKAYPTLLQGWGVILLFLAANIIIAFPMVILEIFGVSIQSGEVKFFSYSLSLVLTIWFTSLWWRKNPKNRKNLSFSKFPFAIVPLMVVMTLALLVLVEAATGWIPMPDWVKELFKEAVSLNYWGFLTVAIAAPFLEEMLMRGVVLEGFLKNYQPGKAILWSAILFGVLHLNPWQFIAGLMSGLIMGWLYWRTKSLWPGIIVHFVNNSLAFLAMVYLPDSEGIFFLDLVGSPWLYALLLVICGSIIWLAYRAIEEILDRKAQPFE